MPLRSVYTVSRPQYPRFTKKSIIMKTLYEKNDAGKHPKAVTSNSL